MDSYCLACWNERNGLHLTEEQVELSKEPRVCAGCGQPLPVVSGMTSELSRSRSLLRQEEKPDRESADLPEKKK